jgi:hypothetical protein
LTIFVYFTILPNIKIRDVIPMKPLERAEGQAGSIDEACCCPSRREKDEAFFGSVMTLQDLEMVSDPGQRKPSWIAGLIHTPVGLVPLASSRWSHFDRLGLIRSRISAFRMNYRVEPGLYAVGRPSAESDIFVSANYKLSFDILRRALKNINGWILVLDTKGINVWCAAGKGTFGTEELVTRIFQMRLADLVSHRRIIVPQLGATGVRASEVRKRTGFFVHFGPVDASNIERYLESEYNADPDMRLVRFTMSQRLALTPMEINQALKLFPLVALIILVFFGLRPAGVIFVDAWRDGWPFILLFLVTVLAGAFITPVLLPFIPFRSFAMKGWIIGAAAVVPLLFFTKLLGSGFGNIKASALVLFPLLSSYLALQFTGATTFTAMSGVKKELRIGLPVYVGGAIIAMLLLVLFKLQSWGIL